MTSMRVELIYLCGLIHRMNKLYYFFCCLNCFLFIDDLIAQNKNENGFAPTLSASVALHRKLDISAFSIAKIAFEKEPAKQNNYQVQTLYIYGQALLTYTANKNWRIGAGYGFQRNNPFKDNWRNENRVVEQVIFSTTTKNIMWHSRLRLEQRWFYFADHSKDFSTRTSGQFGITLPFFSQNIYWQIYDEAYFNLPAKPLFSENWSYAGIGFNLKHNNHIETGIGYDRNVNSKGERINLLLFQITCSWIFKSGDENMINAIICNHF